MEKGCQLRIQPGIQVANEEVEGMKTSWADAYEGFRCELADPEMVNSALIRLIDEWSTADLLMHALEALQSDTESERAFGATALRDKVSRADAAVPPELYGERLLAAVKRESVPWVLPFLVAAFNGAPYPEATGVLCGMAQDPDPELRYVLSGAMAACVTELTDLPRPVLSAFSSLMLDDDDDVAYSAKAELVNLYLFGASKSKDLIALGEALRGDSDERVRELFDDELHGESG